MNEGMRPVLAEAASVFTTAIVTGRSKDKVYNFVGLDDVFYAGSHGLEIQGPLDRPVKCQVSEKASFRVEILGDWGLGAPVHRLNTLNEKCLSPCKNPVGIGDPVTTTKTM
ncbi:unnamed protein product [Laminaria digitata]